MPRWGDEPVQEFDDGFDLRQELLAAFEGEYREHLVAMRATLDAGAVSGPGLRDVFRRAHSLKGAARAVDLPRIELIAHELETVLFASVEAARALPDADVAAVRLGLDQIEQGMRPDADTRGGPDFGADFGIGTGTDSGADYANANADAVATFAADASRTVPTAMVPPAAPPPAHAAAPPDTASRVSAGEIEQLVSSVQAASNAMLGQEQGRQWLLDHAASLGRLIALCDAPGPGEAGRNEKQPDERRPDERRPDERRLGEISRALHALARSATLRLREGRFEDWQREQTVAALRGQVERVALVSADSVFGPLAAMARALGREQGTEITVRFTGMELRADRPVLQALRDPVIQLLRNAVGHGLGRRRDAAGDPTLCLSVQIRAGHLQLEVADNGNGPDLVAIGARARQQGLLAANQAPNEAALLALVFEPGFSTSESVDRLSGRGMGLSIVAEAAARLGGSAAMAALRDRDGGVVGTVLRMSVPLAARRQAVLLLECAGHVLALPSDAVARLHSVAWSAISDGPGGWFARLDADRTVSVRSLAALLHLPAEAAGDGHGGSQGGSQGGHQAQLVLLRGPGAETALLVDRLRSVVTLVVRPPSIVGIDRRLVGGVAVPDDNRPVLVLEPDGLRDAWGDARGEVWSEAWGDASATGSGPGLTDRETRSKGPLPSTRPAKRPTILVVDDSITTRTLEKTILQAQGYAVLIAVDGLEALDVLRGGSSEIDIVVADVEMPRLDGFGLVAAMQADPRLKLVPIVLMTSRNDDADIRRGLELGASAYLTKQEFEQGVLLSVLGQLLP